MENIEATEKVIASLERDDVVLLALNNGITICGTVDDVRFLTTLDNESWHEIVLILPNEDSIKIDSTYINKVIQVVRGDYSDHLVGKNLFEKYGIEYGLSDVEFMSKMMEQWDSLDEEEKADITDTISCSMDGDILKDIFDAYAIKQKQTEEQHEKIMKLLDEINKLTDQKSKNNASPLDVLVGIGALGLLGLASDKD